MKPFPPMVIAAINIAALLIRRFEGLYLTPYLCPAGIPTIGYGATYYENGEPVRLTDPAITREHAEQLLLWMLYNRFVPVVLKFCPGADTAPRLAAIIDFTYNLGTGRLRPSTLRRKVNESDWEAVVVELKKWVKGGGRTLRGLVARRAAECDLIF